MKLKSFPVFLLIVVISVVGVFYWRGDIVVADSKPELLQFESAIGRVYLYPIAENNNDVLMTLLVHAGAWHNQDRPGHAHFLEHLVWHRANRSNGSGQILPAQTWPTHTIYNILTSEFVLARELERLSSLLQPVANLPQAAIEQQHGFIIEEFENRYLSAQVRASSHFAAQQALLAGTNLPIDQMTSRPNTALLTAKEAQAFQTQFYTPENISIFVSGDVSKADILDVLGDPPAPLEHAERLDLRGEFNGKNTTRQTVEPGAANWTGVSLSHLFEIDDCGTGENCDSLTYLAFMVVATVAQEIAEDVQGKPANTDVETELMLDQVVNLGLQIDVDDGAMAKAVEKALFERFDEEVLALEQSKKLEVLRAALHESIASDVYDFDLQHSFITLQLSRRNKTPYSKEILLEAISSASTDELKDWFINMRGSGNRLLKITTGSE